MTEEKLNEIIKGAKEQLRYEDAIMDACRVIFPESCPPVVVNPLWKSFNAVMDIALGVEDLFGWWVWETECGTTGSAWIELDGVRYPLTNAREILEYAEAEKNCKEDKNR